MYGKTAVLGFSTTAALSFTGAPIAAESMLAVVLVLVGLLLVRSSRRRGRVDAGS